MKRVDIQCGPYRIRGVDDWLVFVTDTADHWGYFTTECDPAWRDVPGNPSVFTDEGCIQVGRDMIGRGVKPSPVWPDCLADTIQHFGEACDTPRAEAEFARLPARVESSPLGAGLSQEAREPRHG